MRFLSFMCTLELNGSLELNGCCMTNASEDGRLKRIEKDRKRVRKQKKRVKRKVGGGKRHFFGFLFCFQPP